MEIREKLEAGRHYHICIKANAADVLFRDTADYMYFTKKMHLRLTEAWSILAYTLLPEEIHLVVKVRLDSIDNEKLDHATLLSHLLNGYVQHYNCKYLRTGSLMQRSFRRKSINSKDELQERICQVNSLPVAKNLAVSPEKWDHGSFKDSHYKKNRCEIAWSELEQLFEGWKNYFVKHLGLDALSDDLTPRKFWRKILSPLEIEFRKWNPLGVHRWCRRPKPS